MGLFSGDNIGRAALGWSTGGLSELGRKDPFGISSDNGYSAKTYKPTASLQAGDIQIDPDLAASLGGIATAGTAGIKANYDRQKARTASESAVRGTGPNSYAANRFGVQQGLDKGGLEAALGGELGKTAYTDTKAEREYNQNMSLTDQIANAMKPSMLDQVFSGIGIAGKAGGQYGALMNPKTKKTANYPMTAENDYSDMGGEAYA